MNPYYNTRKEYRESHKESIKEYRRKYFQDNKERENELRSDRKKYYNNYRRDKIRAILTFLREIKEESKCSDCGNYFPHYVMEFDHRDGVVTKVSEVTQIAWKASWSRVLEELDKCDIVCANCHKIRTHNRRK